MTNDYRNKMDNSLRLNNSLISYFFVFIIIYISEETVIFGTNSNTIFTTFGKRIGFFIIAALFFLLLFSRKRKMHIPTLLLAALICFLFILTMIIHNEDANVYIFEISLIISAALLKSVIPFSDFKKAFCDIIFLLACFSLFFYLLQLISFPLLNYLPQISNYQGYQYRTYLLGNTNIVSRELLRNPSIFRESGVYALYLLLALFFNLFGHESEIK